MPLERRGAQRHGITAVRHVPLALALALAAASAAAGVVACKDAEKPRAEQQKSPLDFFEGDRPTWPSELEGASLGQPRDTWKQAGLDTDHFTSTRFDGVAFMPGLDRETGLIEDLSIAVETDEPLDAVLTERWGQPHETRSFGEPALTWVNPETRLRVRREPNAGDEKRVWLRYDHYQPLAELLGSQPAPLAFEQAAPILGKTAEELIAAYPDHYRVPEGNKPDQGHFELPPTEFEADKLWLIPSFDARGRVSAYTLTLQVPTAARPALLAQLEKRFGTPREGQEHDTAIEIFLDREHRVRVRVDPSREDEVVLHVETFTPLVELLGADQGRLGFEGDEGWIGTLTRDEFEKLAAFEPTSGDLQLPPTELALHRTAITPTFADGKVASYRFKVDYGLVPAARDELRAAFVKRFGEPTEGVTGLGGSVALIFPTTPSLSIEESSYGRGWTVRVGEGQ